MADVKFTIVVDAEKAKIMVREFGGEVEKLGKTSQVTEPAFAKLTGAVAAGMVAYQAAAKIVSKYIGFVKDCVGAAMEAEEAEKAVQLALETTGREVQQSSRHFFDYANQLQKVTRYDDEAIKRTQALLIQLTNLDRQGIDKATRGPSAWPA